MGFGGRRSRNFSIEINHGGFFVGHGRNRAYVNGRAIWYDNVEKETWSPILIESLVEEIGYEMAGRLKVFYCVPILTPSTNGLRELSDEEQTDRMMVFVDIGHHFFSIYLDHDDSLQANSNEDDVVHYPRAHLPPVISPAKRIPSSTVQSETEEAEAGAETDEGEAGAETEQEEAGPETEQADVEPEIGALIPLQVIFPEQETEANTEMQAEDVGGSTSMRRSARQSKCSYAMEEEDAGSDTDDEDYDPGLLVDSDNERRCE
ncbi:ubiquitin carboxyl-terminal hydrolase 13 [Hordeum vulgare]|nr:ubiquitin carboxyl-terminal hydrolase 13 [Hordeum vulgare]